MNVVSDVIGYPLEEALHLLDIPVEQVLIVESQGKNKIDSGNCRVIQQKTLENGKVKLVVSYF